MGGMATDGRAPGARMASAALMALAGCSWFEPQPADDVVVRLTPKEEGAETLIITARQLRRELARKRVQVAGDLDAPPLPAEVQRAVLDQLIETVLFAQRARELGLTVSSTVVDAELEALRAGLPEADLERMMNQTYQTDDHLKKSIRERLLTERLLARDVDPRISSAEVEARFNEWEPERKMHPPQVRAGQIVVPSEQKAIEVKKRLKDGEPFERVAMEYSVAPNADAGGYLGWFARDEMPEIVDDTCFELEPGTLSDIVPSEYGYHIFKVYERTEGRPVELEEVRDEVERSIIDERSRIARQRLEARLKDRYVITEDEEAIREVFQWGR